MLDYTDISNNTITVHDSLTVQNNKLSDKLGLGTTTPNVILEIVDTGSVRIPVGDTSERGTVSGAGYLRYNSEKGNYEGYDGTQWRGFAGDNFS